MTSGGRRISTASPALYPMWVLSVNDFMRLGANAPSHQELLCRGLLTEWRKGLGPVAFCSHQWMAYDHADPGFQQLDVLQAVVRRIQRDEITEISFGWDSQLCYGTKACEECMPTLRRSELQEWVDTGYIWFDYFCVPQTTAYDPNGTDEMMAAVNSIPAYIEQSQHFIVLCPPLEHMQKYDGEQLAVNDYSSWCRRGWCRAEACVRLLSRNSGPMIKIDSTGTPQYIVPWEAWFMQPGHGEFTCCHLGHKMSQHGQERELACDKKKISGLVRQLIDKRVATLCEELDWEGNACEEDRQGRLREMRLVRSIREFMLSGLEREEDDLSATDGTRDPAAQLRAFMAANRFAPDLVNGDGGDHGSGWTPLRFAAMSDRRAIVCELLRRGADPEAPLDRPYPEMAMCQGQTVLGSAAYFAGASGGVLQALLAGGADVGAVDAHCTHGAVYAAIAGNVGTLRVLLAEDPTSSRRRDGFGLTPLLLAVLFNRSSCHVDGEGCVEALLTHVGGVDESETGFLGHNALMMAAFAPRGSPRALSQLLSHPGCLIRVNRRTRWTDFHPPFAALVLASRCVLSLTSLALARRLLGPPSPMLRYFARFGAGWTALSFAAAQGSVPHVRALLAAGADPLTPDDGGRTARDLAREFGPYPLLDSVLARAEHASRSLYCDAWPRSDAAPDEMKASRGKSGLGLGALVGTGRARKGWAAGMALLLVVVGAGTVLVALASVGLRRAGSEAAPQPAAAQLSESRHSGPGP